MILCQIVVFKLIFSSVLTAPSPEPNPESKPAHSPEPTSATNDENNDDYYVLTATSEDINKILPQDKADAEIIKDKLENDGDMKQETIASILAYRDPVRRIAINHVLRKEGQPLINSTYVLEGSEDSIFYDICFALVEEEAVVTSVMIGNGLVDKDETLIIIGMVLTKDMENMIRVFDAQTNDKTFEKHREDQRHPFRNMLRVWALKSREHDERGPLDQTSVKNDADALLKEQCKWNDKWNNKRDQLELILMVKSIKYARAVIAEFENQRNKVLIETIINSTIKNKDLADAYSSLARYIKNRHQYIADTIHRYMDNCDDGYEAWILALGTVRPQEWPKINAAYKSQGNKDLSQVVGKTDDLTFSVFHEMIAVTVDHSFQATQFTSKTAQSKSSQQHTH